MEQARAALLSKGDAFDVALLDNVRVLGWVTSDRSIRSNVCMLVIVPPAVYPPANLCMVDPCAHHSTQPPTHACVSADAGLVHRSMVHRTFLRRSLPSTPPQKTRKYAGGAILAEPIGPEPAGGAPAHDGDAAGRRDVVRVGVGVWVDWLVGRACSCVCVYMEARLPQSIDDQPTDPPHPKRRHCCRKRVDAVLEQSKNPATRFFGLQILEDTIKTRCVLLCICVCVCVAWRRDREPHASSHHRC